MPTRTVPARDAALVTGRSAMLTELERLARLADDVEHRIKRYLVELDQGGCAWSQVSAALGSINHQTAQGRTARAYVALGDDRERPARRMGPAPTAKGA